MYVTVFIIYLLTLIVVGAFRAKKVKTQADFCLAGRGLPTLVLSGTLLATWTGTGSIFGYAEETYRVGIPAFLLTLSSTIGILVLYFLSARIRKKEFFTIQDILEERFGPLTRILGTITLLLAYVIIVSYQYRAGSAVFERLFPSINHHFAIMIVAFFIMIYTALAGMYSVAYTDVVNGILMIVGVGIALFFLLGEAGGLGAVVESLPPEKRNLFGHYSPLHLLSVFLPVFLLVMGDANMFGRFFSAKSPQTAQRSALVMLIGVFILDCAIIATSVVGLALVGQGVLSAPTNEAHIIVHLAFEVLPPFIGAILVSTVMAVIISTADSFLLTPSTSLVRDIYQRFINPSAKESTLVIFGRLTVIVLGLVALILAFTSNEFFSLALFAYTIYGAGITPSVIAGLFWKRATPAGAASSIIVGISTAIIWKFAVVPQFPHWEIDAVIPALLLNIIVLIGVSLVTQPKGGKDIKLAG